MDLIVQERRVKKSSTRADDADEQSVVLLRDYFCRPVEIPRKLKVFSTALRLVEVFEIRLKATDEQQRGLQGATTCLDNVVADRAKQTKPINLNAKILAFPWDTQPGDFPNIFVSVSF